MKQPRKNRMLEVKTLRHEEATRRNIPTAEYQSVLQKEAPILSDGSLPLVRRGDP